MVYADVFRPSVRRQAAIYDVVLVLGASLFIALAARIAVPLPFSPVPVTGQTLAVLLVGALLGSRRGALSVLAYLTEGAMGLPVFAGGAAGVSRLIGPTGGYLLGFVIAAFLTGWLAERGWDRRFATTLAMMGMGNAAIYLLGLPYLASFVGVGHVLALGLYPFVVGDIAKSILAALLLPSAWKLLNSH
jgi:biotin transport system substrate-specific component